MKEKEPRGPDSQSADPTGAGLSLTDILELPEPKRALCYWMVRRGDVRFEEIVEQLGGDDEGARTLVATLVQDGTVREVASSEGTMYRVAVVPRRKLLLPAKLNRLLDDLIEER